VIPPPDLAKNPGMSSPLSPLSISAVFMPICTVFLGFWGVFCSV
jgi:hypothetical protein